MTRLRPRLAYPVNVGAGPEIAIGANARDARATPTAVARAGAITRPVRRGSPVTTNDTVCPRTTRLKSRQRRPPTENVPGADTRPSARGGRVHSRTLRAPSDPVPVTLTR